MNPDRIIITVEPTVRTNIVPAVKKALKALRRAGLRCVDIRWADGRKRGQNG